MVDDTSLTASSYTFGDTVAAGDRLALVAEVFRPTTAAFLESAASPRPRLTVDLGCGPGHTTRLLAEITGSVRTVGIDQSAAFVARAEADAPPGVTFAVHDVTKPPFPTPAPPDLLFARYVVAHLADPMTTIARWIGALARGGRLLLEEVERIDTTIATFARYLEVVAAMMASRGGDLYIGRRLSDAAGSVRSDRATIAPPTSVVATMFRMNLENWRHDRWVVANVQPSELDRLHRALVDLSHDARTGEIEWQHRRVVYERPT
jgi:trans-aconitate 2-methyltransferase